jgi:hypothetical protein
LQFFFVDFGTISVENFVEKSVAKRIIPEKKWYLCREMNMK